MRLIEHKNEIVAAVIGALTAGLLSFVVGFYTINRTFQMAQSKELILGLKLDISALKNVERELDENIKLLLSNSYQIKAKFESYEYKLPAIGVTKQEKNVEKYLAETMERAFGKQFIVTELQLPSDRFVIGSWQLNGPNSTDINFELVQALNELNRKLFRANGYLERLSMLHLGRQIEEGLKNELEKNNPRFNSMIAEISQTKLVQIKNLVTEEIKKLQKKQDEISL